MIRWRLTHPLAVLLLSAFCVIAGASDMFEYTAAEGDTVSGIAQKYLADPRQWPRLVQLNKLQDADRIQPGAKILIPLELMRSQPAAQAASVQGRASAALPGKAAVPLVAGAQLPEGTLLATDADGYVTLQLADGSTVRVQAGSKVKLDKLRSDTGTTTFEFGLIAGRIESLVARLRGANARFEVRTPQVAASVRGTNFRVSLDASSGEARSEVLEGSVAAAGRANPKKAIALEAGFGAVASASGALSDPIALPQPPHLDALPALVERVLMRFDLEPASGVAAYRAQIAADPAFDRIVAEARFASPRLRFGGLPDGDYYLRVRAIESHGLEGGDAVHAFRLKARAEAPLVSLPAQNAQVSAAAVEFTWAENPEAGSYHLQLARDSGFGDLVADERALRAARYAPPQALAHGVYFWRVASVGANGDRGPFGETQSFTAVPTPATPALPQAGYATIALRWPGEPGETFEVQLARDALFAKVLAERRVSKPEVELPRPGAYTYFMRYRVIDADGNISPYSSPQRFQGWVHSIIDADRPPR